MTIFFVRLTFAFLSICALSTPAVAGQLDEHYLAAFNYQTTPLGNNVLQKAILLPATAADGTPHCGTPLKHGLRRDWSRLEVATQTILAKQLAAPVLTNELTFASSGGHFKIHYAATGSDAPPMGDIGGIIGVPDWIETVAATFEQVLASYIALGYNPAPTLFGAPYDVYLRDLSTLNYYGQTTSSTPIPSPGFSNAYSSFMEIDNNFTDGIYINAAGGPYSTIQSLQITAAHEYHHAIQYGYNFFFDIWYAEATSTWYEDELYDSVNQLHAYLPAWFSNSTLSLDTAANINTGGGYSRWIFNRYLSEQHSGIIKASWDRLAIMNSPGGNTDIPMVPVLESLLPSYSSTLGSDFYGFAKRVYFRDWSSHVAEIGNIQRYSPIITFGSYPASSTRALPHYSFAFFTFTPSMGAPDPLTISLTKTSGIRTAAFKNLSGNLSEITANPDGSYTIAGFNALNAATDDVVLLVVNSTNVDNHMAAFSTDGSAAVITEPPNIPVSNLSAATTVNNDAPGGGGGSGCFIATAAYGSYLHPQVQILRNFRDHYLLTNPLGRSVVALYYRISPPLADFIAQHELMRGATRLALAPVILFTEHPASVAGAALLLLIMVLSIAHRAVSRNRIQPTYKK